MEPDPDVLEMVRRQLDRDPPPSTEALYGRAARINDRIYGLSLRQFNATYVLRVKRERKREERDRKASGSPGDQGGGEADREVDPRPGGFLDALEDSESGEGEPDGGAGGTGGGTGGGSDAGEHTGEDVGGPEEGPGTGPDGMSTSELRGRVRELLWGYAREVAARAGIAGAVRAVESVDRYVEELAELATAARGDAA